MIRLDAWMRPGELDQTLSSNLSYCQPPNLFGSLAVRSSRMCDSLAGVALICATLACTTFACARLLPNDRLALL